MSKSAEIEKMARLALSRQAETDMRVDAVEARAAEAADAAAGGRTPPPAAAPSLDGLYGWRPKAFSVWFTTGGGGKVGVSFPEKCVSYNGNHMDDGVLTPSVQEDPETKFRWCELEAPSEKAPKLIFTLVRRGGEGDNAGEGGISAAYLEWVESVDDAKADHGASDETVLVCVPIAEYDAGLDRLVQVHVGALALGGKSDSVTPDDVSTEFVPEPEEGEEPTGDEGKLQIFDFNSNESDSPEGLAERLHADTETGDITIQSGTNIMLLARRDGKMVYIPLTAGGTDPEDEKPYDPENPDPCAHPGDNAPGAETHSGGGGGGVVVGGGGVAAGDDIHTGDDDCNCERI